MADGTSRISRDGKPLLHYSGVSTWADHMVVDQACCEVIPDEVPYEVLRLSIRIAEDGLIQNKSK